MKRILIFSIFLVACSLGASAEKTWAQHERYAASNDTVKARMRMPEYGYNKALKTRRVEAVLLGNSITDGWASKHPEFFAENNFVGRGISGQVTAQMLSRFQADVVALNPKMVIIMAGTNDIAQNNGYIEHEHILQNIQSMCELAKYNKIKPVLCSCLPAAAFYWRKNLTIKFIQRLILQIVASPCTCIFLFACPRHGIRRKQLRINAFLLCNHFRGQCKCYILL